MKIVKIGAMWCPACIITNKYWNDIKKEFNDILFDDLDIDMNEEETSKYDINEIVKEAFDNFNR